MEKIPTIFKRDPEDRSRLLDEPHPDCDWVFRGEGVATRKYDGTCVLIETDGTYYKRREIKKGKKAPDGFMSVSFDPNTGKTIGWVEVDSEDPGNKWHMEGLKSLPATLRGLSGTFELCGPKIQGNPEGYNHHVLIPHEFPEQYENVPRSFDGLIEWLKNKDIEGIVFHHLDGRMAKIKKRDFGLSRK